MSTAQTECKVDRTNWPEGPWDAEPDRLEWKTKAGFPAIAHRHPQGGHWCGYVGVPNGHLLYGQGEPDSIIDVHGGVTYASRCDGHICHVPAPGESDDVWWLGFDCAHHMDAAPQSKIPTTWAWQGKERVELWGPEARYVSPLDVKGFYRTLEFVKAECERAAKELAEMQGR